MDHKDALANEGNLEKVAHFDMFVMLIANVWTTKNEVRQVRCDYTMGQH